jgi:hypothetical protein
MSQRFALVLVPVLLALAAACGEAPPPPPPVTLALVNAAVWTGDPARPEAQAVAVNGDRIVAVGTTDEIRAMAGAAEVVDVAGQFVVPGFIDAHVHFLDGGARLASVQLRDARTPEEFTARIAAFAGTVPAGTWIVGGDWDRRMHSTVRLGLVIVKVEASSIGQRTYTVICPTSCATKCPADRVTRP